MNNKLERKEFLAGILTMFGGTLFIEKEEVGFINLLVFFLVVFNNFAFLFNWIY